jgi:hypothetical protein
MVTALVPVRSRVLAIVLKRSAMRRRLHEVDESRKCNEHGQDRAPHGRSLPLASPLQFRLVGAVLPGRQASNTVSVNALRPFGCVALVHAPALLPLE